MCVYVCVCVCVYGIRCCVQHTHTRTRSHLHIHAHAHTHARKHTNTYTHTRAFYERRCVQHTWVVRGMAFRGLEEQSAGFFFSMCDMNSCICGTCLIHACNTLRWFVAWPFEVMKSRVWVLRSIGHFCVGTVVGT